MRPSDIRTVAAVLGLLACLLPACSRPSGRTRFNSPDDAAKALLAALETNDTTELKAIFGPNAEQDLSSATRSPIGTTARSSPSRCGSPGSGSPVAPTAASW